VEWLCDRIEQSAAGWAPVSWPAARREAFLADFRALDAFLAEQLEEAPVLAPLIQRMARLVAEEEAAAPPPQPEPLPAPSAQAEPARSPGAVQQAWAQATTAPQLPAGTAPPRPAPQAPQDPQRLLARTLEDLRAAAALLLDQTPEDPAPYLLNRTAAWTAVAGLPAAVDGVTRIPPPGAQETQALRLALQAGTWSLVVANGEALLSTCLFWLDLNRMVTEALDRLGRPLAARAVEREARAFALRLPGLDDLSFADRTPFADPDTRQWLRAPGRPLQAAAGGDPDPGLAGMLAEAEALADAGDRSGALELLMGRCRTADSARTALGLKQGICALLGRSGQPRAAEAFARAILADLEEFQVHRWEPRLAAGALRTALAALKGARNEECLARAMDRLALLDPAGLPGEAAR
jgi:type VI secretion system protein VasJ